jgi:murein DD-endopeptidase MepM/ murein hydrolase activator NlpD
MYEVGVLGGALRRRGYAGGGFVYGGHQFADPRGPSGRGTGPTGGYAAARDSELVETLRGMVSGNHVGARTPEKYRYLDPLIAEAARKGHVPEGIVRSVVQLESSFNPNIINSIGAAGLMQLMPSHYSRAHGARSDFNPLDPQKNLAYGTAMLSNSFQHIRKRTLANGLRLTDNELWRLAVASHLTGLGDANHKGTNRDAVYVRMVAYEYAHGRIPNTSDSNMSATTYANRIIGTYAQSKIIAPPLGMSPELAAAFDKNLPRMRKEYGGNLERYIREGLNFKGDSAKLANDLRRQLDRRGLWLPYDDPGAWQNISGSRLGIIPSSAQASEVALNAMGLRGAGVTKGAHVITHDYRSMLAPAGYVMELTSHYGWRSAGFHAGEDWAIFKRDAKGRPIAGSDVNAPILARDAGKVVSARWDGGYGWQVGVKTDSGYLVRYSHVSGFNVKVGDTVAAGQQIATQGNTGSSRGHHVDISVKALVNGVWQTIDPSQMHSQYKLVAKPDPVRIDLDKKFKAEIFDKFGGDVERMYLAHGVPADKAREYAAKYYEDMPKRGFSLSSNRTAHQRPTVDTMIETKQLGQETEDPMSSYYSVITVVANKLGQPKF